MSPHTILSIPLPDGITEADVTNMYAEWIGKNLDVGIVTDVDVTPARRTLILTIDPTIKKKP